ncbi:MAG: hypothetical protein U9Q72_03015 [Patescibacteria group bacterium]|nr:hypothetical protein [Patescibacteria group bacterium]
MKNIKKLKISLKKDDVIKEKITAVSMSIFVFIPVLSLIFCWYYFNLNLDKQLEAIATEKEIKFDYEINPQDLKDLKDFFKERQRKYQESNELQIREIF